MTKNRGHSVDTHFHDWAGSILLSLLSIMPVNALFITIGNLLPARKYKIHHQESWTLHWHSFSWWGWECFIWSFAYEGSKNCVDDYLQPLAYKITQDTWPRFIDAPLTHILSRVYPQYVIISLRLLHNLHCVGSLLSVFIQFHLNHCIVL